MFAYCCFDNEKFPSKNGRIYYPCEYEISEDGEMKVTIVYDLASEIRDRKGTNRVSSSEKCEARDILICDENKTFFLKNANNLGIGIPGRCEFIAHEYFEFKSLYLDCCKYIFFAKCILDEHKENFLKFASEWKGENSDYWRKIFVENSNKNTVEDALKAIRSKPFDWNKLFSGYSCYLGDSNIEDEFNRKYEDSMFKIFSEYKVKSIRIYSKSLIRFIPDCIYTYCEDSKCVLIEFNKELQSNFIEINSNNIDKISLGGSFHLEKINDEYHVCVKYVGFIQIDLIEDVDCSEVYDYLEEIMVYFQLFCPDRIKIDKVEIDTGYGFFKFVTAYFNCRFNNDAIVSDSRYIPNLVSVKKEKILDFLGKCYNKIVYRKPTHEEKLAVKLIDEIIFSDTFKMWWEITFLHCFTFIELFFKKERIQSLSKKLKQKEKLKDELKERIEKESSKEKVSSKYKMFLAIYNSEGKLSFCEQKNKANDIVNFRNIYSHEGYYISDRGIEYGTGDNCKKDGSSEAYELLRTVLFPIATDIIFKDILGYEHYEFPSPFHEGLF